MACVSDCKLHDGRLSCYVYAVLDVMRRLLQPKNIMVSAHARTKEYDKSKYISILNIIQVSLRTMHIGDRTMGIAPNFLLHWKTDADAIIQHDGDGTMRHSTIPPKDSCCLEESAPMSRC